VAVVEAAVVPADWDEVEVVEERPSLDSMAARRSRTPSRTPQRGFNCSDMVRGLE